MAFTLVQISLPISGHCRIAPRETPTWLPGTTCGFVTPPTNRVCRHSQHFTTPYTALLQPTAEPTVTLQLTSPTSPTLHIAATSLMQSDIWPNGDHFRQVPLYTTSKIQGYGYSSSRNYGQHNQGIKKSDIGTPYVLSAPPCSMPMLNYRHQCTFVYPHTYHLESSEQIPQVLFDVLH